MFKKKPRCEIDENKLKALKLFESVDGNYNSLGFAVSYTRIPGGVIRTIINNTCLDQQFIALPDRYFICQN